MLLGSKTISLEEFKIQYSVCFVWFAKLQPYKFESFYHRFDITMEHYSNILKEILTDSIFKMVPFPIVVLEWKKNKENNYSKILYLTCVLSSCQNTVRFRLASFIVDKTGSALKLAQNQYILVTS